MPLRILHISTRLILGGSQENTVLSCEGQARLGHDVHLAFGPIYGPEGSLLDRAERFRLPDGQGGRGGITTHTVPTLEREIMPRTDWRCYHDLRRLIADLRPDIVHTHSSKAGILGRGAAWAEVGRCLAARVEYAGYEVRMRLRHPPFAVIHTIHGPPFHAYQSRLKNALYIASERWAARRCHAIVSVADAMTRQYLAAGIGRSDQYTTIYSGMETETFLSAAPGETREASRAELGLAPGDFVIGTVARLAELKGHDDLLDALGDDLRANPSWRLLWVGDGWWRDRLLKRVADMGLTGQVLTTGLVPQHRIPAMLRAMDLLAHPSYREGLPRTVPQALLCGVPVVAYDVDGTAEACRDEAGAETGRLVPPGDTAALRGAVRWMADHPAERALMAERGRAFCRTRFSAERMVYELERLYARILEGC